MLTRKQIVMSAVAALLVAPIAAMTGHHFAQSHREAPRELSAPVEIARRDVAVPQPDEVKPQETKPQETKPQVAKPQEIRPQAAKPEAAAKPPAVSMQPAPSPVKPVAPSSQATNEDKTPARDQKERVAALPPPSAKTAPETTLREPTAPQTATPEPPAIEPSKEADVSPNADDPSIGAAREHRPISVLQIGDSHTAADYFTGEVRRVLQARYGNGGAGYLEVGTPRAGVLSTNLRVKASAGWTYAGIQQPSAEVESFAFSGFRASANQAGETVSFEASGRLPFTNIDIEVGKGPGQGAIDVLLDGHFAAHASLDAPVAAQDLVRIQTRSRSASLKALTIRTTEAKPTSVLSVSLFNRQSGLAYSNLGFPGATIDILNKFPEATVIEALRRLSPGIVVLSFGTNEGFNDKLDLDQYAARYIKAIRTIRAGAPNAKLVMIGPSDANRVPATKTGPSTIKVADKGKGDGKPAEIEQREIKRSGLLAESGTKCPYPTPPQLDRVRDVQRDLAAKEGIAFWDWSSIMPQHCGAQAWVSASPRLMGADHVHFTKDGYRRSARSFAEFLDPIVTRVRDTHVVSNH